MPILLSFSSVHDKIYQLKASPLYKVHATKHTPISNIPLSLESGNISLQATIPSLKIEILVRPVLCSCWLRVRGDLGQGPLSSVGPVARWSSATEVRVTNP